MKKYIAFLFWVPKHFAAKVATVHSEYVDMLRNEPGLGLFLAFVLTMLAVVLTAIMSLAIFGEPTIAAMFTLIPLIVIPLHYAVVQVQRLYSLFNQERQNTFDALK